MDHAAGIKRVEGRSDPDSDLDIEAPIGTQDALPLLGEEVKPREEGRRRAPLIIPCLALDLVVGRVRSDQVHAVRGHFSHEGEAVTTMEFKGICTHV